MRKVTFALMVAFIAGCSKGQDPCRVKVSAELHQVQHLIAETEATLQRGYALDRQDAVIEICPTELGSCGLIGTSETQTRRAILTDDVARQLFTLRERERALSAATTRMLEACSHRP